MIPGCVGCHLNSVCVSALDAGQSSEKNAPKPKWSAGLLPAVGRLDSRATIPPPPAAFVFVISLDAGVVSVDPRTVSAEPRGSWG